MEITTIFGGMTPASNFIEAHDHAEAAGAEWPASDELKTEYDELAQFNVEHRKRMKQQEKDLEHLKGKN